MEQVLAGGDKRRSGVTSTARSRVELGGMAQLRFADGRVWMDTRMMVLSCGVAVTSMIVWPDEVDTLVTPEGGTTKDGGC